VGQYKAEIYLAGGFDRAPSLESRPLGGRQHATFDWRGEGASDAQHKAERESLMASMTVRERAEMRKREEEEQYAEALRQARIEAAAERRMAADRARIRAETGEFEQTSLDAPVHVAVPARRPPMPSSTLEGDGYWRPKVAGTGARGKAKKGPFGATWNNSPGGGWAMIGENLLDEDLPQNASRPASRLQGTHKATQQTAPTETSKNAARERQERSKKREEEQYAAALTAARKEAAAERRRLSLAQQRAEYLDAQALSLADVDPSAFGNIGWDAFKGLLQGSKEQVAAALQPHSAAAAAPASSGLICVELDPPKRRTKPKLSSQRRSDEGQNDVGKPEVRPGGKAEAATADKAAGRLADEVPCEPDDGRQPQTHTGRRRATWDFSTGPWDLSPQVQPKMATHAILCQEAPCRDGRGERDADGFVFADFGGERREGRDGRETRGECESARGKTIESAGGNRAAGRVEAAKTGGGGGRAGGREEQEGRERQAREQQVMKARGAGAAAPGKAAKAAMEIEAKRLQRRAAAEAEKAQREAEVALPILHPKP